MVVHSVLAQPSDSWFSWLWLRASAFRTVTNLTSPPQLGLLFHLVVMLMRRRAEAKGSEPVGKPLNDFFS